MNEINLRRLKHKSRKVSIGLENVDKCKCEICKVADIRKWDIISKCHCDCHNSTKIMGHDSLCCEYPNGKKFNNPYNE